MLQSITKRDSDASSLSCPAHDCSLLSNQAVFPKCQDEPKKGTDLRGVQEAMGHKHLKTSSLYVGLAREQMNKEMQGNAL
jgi:hypothetical protein